MSELSRKLARLRCQPIVIASHRRSGTHLHIDLFRRQFAECNAWKYPNERLSRLYLCLESIDTPSAPTPTSVDQALSILTRCRSPLIKTHAHVTRDLLDTTRMSGAAQDIWRFLRDHAVFCYAYRDGRDVLSSQHLYESEWRDDIDQVSSPASLAQFVRERIDGGQTRPAYWANHVRSALRNPDVVPLRWESLTADPLAYVTRLAGELGVTHKAISPVLPPLRRFSKLDQIKKRLHVRPNSSAITGRPSNGAKPLKWAKAYGEADRRFFHHEAGEALVELGYEPDGRWVGPYEPVEAAALAA